MKLRKRIHKMGGITLIAWKGWKAFNGLKYFKGFKGIKGFKGFKDIKDIKDFMDFKDFKDFKAFKDFKDFKDLKAFKQKCSLFLVLAMLASMLPMPPVADIGGGRAYAEEAIPKATLDLWLKADAGVMADANGKVSKWADQSGKGNDVSQTNANAFPTLVTEAVYGKPAIRFAGDVNGNSKQFLSRMFEAPQTPWTGNSTVIMVMKQNSLAQKNAKGIFANDMGSNIGAWAIVTSSNDPQRLMVLGPRNDGTSSNVLETASTLDPITLSVTIDVSEGRIKSFMNGVSTSNSKNDYYKNFGNFKGYVIGKSYSPSNLHMAADVSEVLVYKGVLSDSDRQAVETYLMNKYYSVSAVKASVPSGSAVMPGSLVALSSPTVGSAVYYTLDGSDPLTSGTRIAYATPLAVSANTTVKAAAQLQGLLDSPVSTFTYTLTAKLESVIGSIPSGNVAHGTPLAFTSNPGASIYYTVDGSDPKTSPTKQLYASPIAINQAMTVKVYASQQGIADSDVSVFTYTVLPALPVTANRVSGKYFSGTEIVLSSGTSETAIYYTLDGSDPKTSPTRVTYAAPITLTAAATLKAYAVKSGAADSESVQYDYTIYAPTTSVTNLPDSYYNRPGLEQMPHLNYEAMRVANVKDFGAAGDGETSDLEAFDRTIAALSAVGGGVVYIPKGFYYFPFDLTDPANRWAYKRAYNNIHFIGEGDQSVIRFKLPGIPTLPSGRTWSTRNGIFSGFSYGWRIDGNDISYLNLAFSWYPRYDSRGGAGGYTVATTGNNIQMNRVTIDQGNIGAVFWQNAKNVYVVDTQVRNTAADSIHFANVANVVAAYNFVDGANDDSIASIDDKGYDVADNHQYLYNTILNSYWGRGITVTGTNHRVEGNWLENIKSSGVYTNNGGQSSVSGNGHDTEHVLIKDNTIIRSGLMGLNDNQKGAIAFNQYKDDLTVENNRVYGGQSYGIYFNPWGPPSTVSNVRIKNNEIAAVAGSAIVLNSNVSINNFEITDNDMFGNGSVGGSVNFNKASISGTVNFAGNKVSQPVSDATYASGFQVVPDQPVYTNPYAGIAAEPSQADWAAAPNVQAAANEINVKDYGAKGDGLSNDIQAFNTALEAIPASGGTLRIPAGTYMLTPDPNHDSRPYSKIYHHLLLEGRSNIHIVGDGDSSVLQFTSADHFGIRFLNMTDSSIRNVKLGLVNKPFMRHNRALLDISGSHQVVADHVTVAQSGGSGIQVDASTGVAVRNSTVTDSNMSGILILASGQVFVENNTLNGNRDNTIFVNKQGSIARQSEYIRIANNTIDGQGKSEQSGIAFASGDNVLAIGNTVKNTHMAGVLLYYTSEVYPTNRITVTGNTLINTNSGANTLTNGAISVLQTKDGNYTITENTIQWTPYSGIWVKDSVLKSLKLTANVFDQVGTTKGTNVDIGSDQLSNIASYTSNADQLAIQTKPEQVTGGSGWGIAVTIQNLLSLQPSPGGKVSITSPDEWAQTISAIPFNEIPAGQLATVIVPIPAPLPANTGAVPFTLKIEQTNGTITQVTKSVNFFSSPYAKTPPVIDGNVSDWASSGAAVLNQASQVNFSTNDWAGVDDLSASGDVNYDANHLYISAVVKDNTHNQMNTGSDLWRGDSLQLAIDAGRATAVGQPGYTSEMTFALKADNQEGQWRTTAPSGKSTGDQFNSRVAITRDEPNKTTTYEIALPWSEILPNGITGLPSRIGYSFLINDDDGAGRRGWIEYMSGIGSGKNPALFGDVLLAAAAVTPPTPPTPPVSNPTPTGYGGSSPSSSDKFESIEQGVLLLPGSDSMVTETSDGKPVTLMTLSDDLLSKALSALSNAESKSIVIKESVNSGLQIELSGKAAAAIAKEKEATVSLVVGQRTLDVPAKLFNLEQTAKSWNVNQDDLKMRLILKPASSEDANKMNAQAASTGGKLVSDGVRFGIFVQSGTQQQEIDSYGRTYVSQTVTIPGIMDSSKMTGVMLDPLTGEAVFVPTIFTVVNGQTIASLRSHGSGVAAIVQTDLHFADMSQHWAEKDVTLMASKMLLKGMAPGEFEPEAQVTRVQLALMLSRGLGLFSSAKKVKEYTDVHETDWYYNQINAAIEAGLLEGFEDGTLKPNEAVTREQMAVMIARAMRYMNDGETTAKQPQQPILNRFDDQAAMHDWAKDAIAACVEAGMMEGMTDREFGAGDTATRAQAAAILVRFLTFCKLIN